MSFFSRRHILSGKSTDICKKIRTDFSSTDIQDLDFEANQTIRSSPSILYFLSKSASMLFRNAKDSLLLHGAIVRKQLHKQR